ncbi:hypothetical protein WA158_004541 [Blastocystis sp. Blastoise]
MNSTLVFLLILFINGIYGNDVFLEAESFQNYGGWKHDGQYAAIMMSPYLIAAGNDGVPVEDATTTVQFPSLGIYNVYVRTYNWVARWNVTYAPGEFEVLINQKPLQIHFGTIGDNWFWQNGGSIDITEYNNTVSLHDLTGFYGRCDALLFTTNSSVSFPEKNPEQRIFRQNLLSIPTEPETEEFDVIVAGGGVAGVAASIAAARGGKSVALIHDRKVLGGNSEKELGVYIGGRGNIDPYPYVGSIVSEIILKDQNKFLESVLKEGVHVFGGYRVYDVETDKTDSSLVTSVLIEDQYNGPYIKRLLGKMFIDSTGNGDLAYKAKGDFDMTLKNHLGSSTLFNFIEKDHIVPIPEVPWALDFTNKTYFEINPVESWEWECGFTHDPIQEGEYIRDWLLRALYGVWYQMKTVKKQHENTSLYIRYHAGMRESRRFFGDIIVDDQMILNRTFLEDGMVMTTWGSIDIHYPDPKYSKDWEGDEFIAYSTFQHYDPPFAIPYRALYSRNLKNVFLAGRDISVTHLGLGPVRVQATTGMMGEIVGIASSFAIDHSIYPRDIYTSYLQEYKNKLFDQSILKYYSWYFACDMTRGGSGTEYVTRSHIRLYTYNSYIYGYFSIPENGQYIIYIKMKGIPINGEYPIVSLRYEGNEIYQYTVTNEEYIIYTYSIPMTKGSRKISLCLLNKNTNIDIQGENTEKAGVSVNHVTLKME